MGGKTKNASGAVVCRSTSPSALRPVHRGPDPEQSAALLAQQPKLYWRHWETFPQVKLDRYVPADLQSFWARLGEAALDQDERQEALTAFFSSLNHPRPSSAIIEEFRIAVLQRFRGSLSQYDLSVSAEAQQLLGRTREQMDHWAQQIEAGSLEPDTLRAEAEQLRQAAVTAGTVTQVDDQERGATSTNRLCEALGIGMYSLALLFDDQPTLNQTLVEFFSEFELNLADRDPEYRLNHRDNDGTSFHIPEVDREAVRDYWQLFLTACQPDS